MRRAEKPREACAYLSLGFQMAFNGHRDVDCKWLAMNLKTAFNTEDTEKNGENTETSH